MPSAHREEHVGGEVLTRASPLPDAGSSWARVAATGRVAAPRPPGVRVALTIGRGRAWALASGRPPHREERAEGCSERPRACAPCPARDPRVRGRQPRPSCSARPLAACTSGACSGSGAPRGVRVRRTARRGAARPPRGRSTCAPGHGEGLYVVLRPAQSRPARSARAWWACSGLPLGPRGWYPADSSAPTRCCGRRGPPACLGGSPECVGHLRRVPGGLEGENRIFGGRHRTSATGFGAWRGGAPFWASRRGTRHPDIDSRPLGAVFIRIRGGRVPIARLAEAPLSRAPRRSPATERGALRPNRGHGGHARSSPTQRPVMGSQGSRRPPGGRVAAWDPNLQIYHDETSYTYTPSSARAARAPCGDDVRAERAPRDRGVH